jgi:hypothetical protein
MINPRMMDLEPKRGDWEEWQSFEGVSEESLHVLRMHIMKAIGRNPEKIYGTRRVNSRIHLMKEAAAEEQVSIQAIERRMKKLKQILEEISEETNDDAESKRRQRKLMQRLIPVLKYIEHEKMNEIFGTGNHEAIFEALNTTEDHRRRVIEWLTATIESEVSEGISTMNERLQSEKVCESYRTSKKARMRRYIEKVHSAPCSINKDILTECYRETWAPPEREFYEADEESKFHLNRKISEDASSEMEEYMMEMKNIQDVIRSRGDLSAYGVDGIGYGILKGAGGEGIKFMQTIIRASIRNGRVMTTWKEATTILFYKKGDREDPSNWRSISITNCIYCIFTCLLARTFQRMNSMHGVYSDAQKGFIQKTKGCSEHRIILNELFHDANRQRKNLIVTVVNFSNAFGSMPHNLILATMKQRNFPAWVINIVKEMYDGATSILQVGHERTEALRWSKGVKQGCPLSPRLFNLCPEPLLQAIRTQNRGCGAVVEVSDDHIEFSVQAYADDVALISQEVEGIEAMMRTLEEFVRWSRMEINVTKCATASYVLDDERHRSSLNRCFQFQGEEIQNLTLSQSLKYLGTVVVARKTVKLEIFNRKSMIWR